MAKVYEESAERILMDTNALRIEIPDDFDLEKTASCGQCFRAKSLGGGVYRFISGEHVIYME